MELGSLAEWVGAGIALTGIIGTPVAYLVRRKREKTKLVFIVSWDKSTRFHLHNLSRRPVTIDEVQNLNEFVFFDADFSQEIAPGASTPVTVSAAMGFPLPAELVLKVEGETATVSLDGRPSRNS